MDQATSQLIFLVSSPRSGSTLLQQLLSNNTFVDTINEPWLLLHFCGLQRPDLLNATFDYGQAQEATVSFLGSTNQKESYIVNLREFLLKIYMPIRISPDTKYILDKTPRYYEILPLIRVVFPEAKIVILKRNPLSVLNSIIDTWNIKCIPQLYSYKRDILNAPFLQHDYLLELSDRNTKVIKYEDLISQPEKEVTILCEWLGIDYQDSILEYTSNAKSQGLLGDKSFKIRAGEVIQNKDRWSEKLKDKVWKKFFLGYIHYLGPRFLEEYGYTLGLQGKKTLAFDTYRYISEHNVANQTPIDHPLTYLYYRLMYKLYSRR